MIPVSERQIEDFASFACKRLDASFVEMFNKITNLVQELELGGSHLERQQHAKLSFDYQESEWPINQHGLRLHLWNTERKTQRIHAHNHSWSFCSLVLRGGIREYCYSSSAGTSQQAYKSLGRSRGLEKAGQCDLDLIQKNEFLHGDFYFKNYEEIHFSEAMTDSTVTLVVRGPYQRRSTDVFLLYDVESSY